MGKVIVILCATKIGEPKRVNVRTKNGDLLVPFNETLDIEQNLIEAAKHVLSPGRYFGTYPAGLATYAQFHPVSSINRVKCADRTQEFEVSC